MVCFSREVQAAVLPVFERSRETRLSSLETKVSSLKTSLVSRDESLISRDTILVSWEGGNLLLSGTVHTWYTRITDENENLASRANRYDHTQNGFENRRKWSIGTSSALTRNETRLVSNEIHLVSLETREKRDASRERVVTYFWAVLYLQCHSDHAINFPLSMSMEISPQESVTVLILTFELDLEQHFLGICHDTDPMVPESD